MIDDHILLLANARIAIAGGILVVLVSSIYCWQSNIRVRRANLLGCIIHFSALYVALILFVAAYISLDMLTLVVNQGFGELELFIALLVAISEASFALLRAASGRSAI
ncbi:MAG: hypothetical protein AAF675_01595 [Pseudomonadota bacterium]